MRVKRILAIILVMILPFTTNAFCSDEPLVSAKAAVCIEYYTGEVIFQKSANEKLPMASTTKLMTALTTLKLEQNLQREFVIPKAATAIEGSSMYLEEGEILTIEELLYGLMLVSGNDAATALAIAICGNEATFVQNMNKVARDMGLLNTNFTNTTGLYDENHYTTALELAKIASKAASHQKLKEIMATKSKVITARGAVKTHSLTNHNRMLSSYRYCVGGKTGFTEKAGRCLVEIGLKDDKRVITVTLNDRDDWQDHEKMLEYCFDKINYLNEFEEGEFTKEINVINGSKNKVTIENSEVLQNIIINNKKGEYKTTIYSDNMLFAPLIKGECVGVVDLVLDNKILSSSKLILKESIDILPPLTCYKKLLINFLNIIEFL
ncbi:MAG: D-alanyl-D-alanine carboxypeptidase family protein [Clostridia bacterium]